MTDWTYRIIRKDDGWHIESQGEYYHYEWPEVWFSLGVAWHYLRHNFRQHRLTEPPPIPSDTQSLMEMLLQ